MAAKWDRDIIRVAVAGDKSEPGCLVFADAVLVAVISHLEETLDGELQHRWYLEAGFGLAMASCRIRSSRVRKRLGPGFQPAWTVADAKLTHYPELR